MFRPFEVLCLELASSSLPEVIIKDWPINTQLSDDSQPIELRTNAEGSRKIVADRFGRARNNGMVIGGLRSLNVPFAFATQILQHFVF
jgi:hypothetical protein